MDGNTADMSSSRALDQVKVGDKIDMTWNMDVTISVQ
jgi:hypothetical protein